MEKTLEQRVEELEKKVAELEEQVPAQQVIEIIAPNQRLKDRKNFEVMLDQFKQTLTENAIAIIKELKTGAHTYSELEKELAHFKKHIVYSGLRDMYDPLFSTVKELLEKEKNSMIINKI